MLKTKTRGLWIIWFFTGYWHRSNGHCRLIRRKQAFSTISLNEDVLNEDKGWYDIMTYENILLGLLIKDILGTVCKRNSYEDRVYILNRTVDAVWLSIWYWPSLIRSICTANAGLLVSSRPLVNSKRYFGVLLNHGRLDKGESYPEYTVLKFANVFQSAFSQFEQLGNQANQQLSTVLYTRQYHPEPALDHEDTFSYPKRATCRTPRPLIFPSPSPIGFAGLV